MLPLIYIENFISKMERKVEDSRNEKRILFPLGIKIESILGLIKALNEVFNKHADIFALANHFDLEADDLLPLLDVIEMLGFATIHAGDVILTPQGEKFLKASTLMKKQMLREKIKEYEPFKAMISLLRKAEEVKAEDIAKELEKLGYSEVNEYGFIERLTQTILEWGVFSELVVYSSEDQSFKLNKKYFKIK
jgi:NitT/TauT family transport system ATP-binding protein